VIRARNRDVRFSTELLENCARETLIRIAHGRIALTGTGEAHLKRALHPDEPHLTTDREIAAKTMQIDGRYESVLHNENESPLFRLFTRKEKAGKAWLDEAQFKAGERLRSDFEKANLQPRISANWEASVASGNRGGAANDISDFAMDARLRVEKAIQALGPELSDIVLDVCCFLKGLGEVERERGWPSRSAKLLLRTALCVLARHYGFQSEQRRRSGSYHLRSWGTPDYRPSLDGAQTEQLARGN
jgi:hypothetical protein